MGNLGSKTKQENSLEVFKKIATSSNSKISSILVGYMMSVDNAARKEISERIEKNHVDLIEFHSVQTKTSTDMLKMNFSTLALAKRYSDIAKETLQLPSRDRYLREEDHSAMNFNHIYDFLHYGYYRSVNSDDNKKEKLEEIDEEIIDAFTIMKFEVESWRDSPMTTQEEKKYFEEFHKIFDSFENNRKTDWKTVSEKLGNFINEQVKVLERLSERSVEAFMLALSLYVFSSLRKDAVTIGSIEQITNVIDNACAHIQQCFTNLHVDNSEAFFQREKGLYIGIDKLPGVGPVDIFAGLIRGLQSAVIQKLKCERSISVMSIDATTSSVTSNTEDEAENHCIAKGCSKLDLTRPASFKSSDKENNIKFQVDIRVPVFYNLSCNDPNRLWDYRYEIWEFKSLEHSVYFSPLAYRIVTELSAIHSSLEDISKQIGQGTTRISSSSSTIQTTVTKTNQPSYKDYTRFEKTLRRKVYYLANIERSKDIIVEIQEPWMGMA